MSNINTSGLDTNYPVPGKNNPTSGFRDNFTIIKNNLNTASTEITDLQTKAVLKSALNNANLDNNMANTLISNASTRGFRATTYNLGNALAGTVVVNVNQGDVQYGAVTGNVTLQFTGWSPVNTESNVALQLTIANANATISLPSSCVSSNNNFGVTLLENYANVSNVATITAPANTEILEYTFSSLDCGNTIGVFPINRPYQSTQIQSKLVSPTGFPGDVNGDVIVSNNATQLSITSSNAADYFVVATGNTTQLYLDLPIVFTGNSFEANITSGTTYYIRNVVNSTQFTVSSSIGGGNVNLAGSTGTMFGNPASYLYICTDSYHSTAYAKTVANTFASGNIIQLNNTTGLTVNSPIIFTGTLDTANTHLVDSQVYYIKTLSSPNVTISMSRINGVAGSAFAVGNNGTISIAATSYVGNDIWRRINLNSF